MEKEMQSKTIRDYIGRVVVPKTNSVLLLKVSAEFGAQVADVYAKRDEVCLIADVGFIEDPLSTYHKGILCRQHTYFVLLLPSGELKRTFSKSVPVDLLADFLLL